MIYFKTSKTFVFNYIANIVRATKSRAKISGPDDLERILLSGPEFKDIKYINRDDLDIIVQAIRGSVKGGATFVPSPPGSEKDAPEIEGLRAEADKLSRALDRLKKAFLFDDSGIPESEYLSTRSDLQERLTAVNNKIADALTGDSYSEAAELSFVNSASSFLLSYRLQSGDHIDYSDFASTVDKQVLKDFVSLVIDRIIIKDSKIQEIVFKNGLCNRFIY